MNSDIKRIIKHRRDLTRFFGHPARHQAIEEMSPSALLALNALIRFTERVMRSNHPKDHKELRHYHGDVIDNLMNAHDEFDHRQRLHREAEHDKQKELRGGSFFGSIGHFFKKAANTVGHAFKKAGETVYDKAIKPAVKGVESVGKDIYHGITDIGAWIVKNRKMISNIVDKAIGILAVLPIPEIQQVAQALKPFADTGNKVIQGTGLKSKMIGLPMCLTEYPRDNLIKRPNIF